MAEIATILLPIVGYSTATGIGLVYWFPPRAPLLFLILFIFLEFPLPGQGVDGNLTGG
ncbi:hypothetical protein BYT27DRAFT_7187148 [Phlegmacium glaucopus]|nr:hypothetical protein BYT27DRAFT_7187148 [Phlegmacium glaucopus]